MANPTNEFMRRVAAAQPGRDTWNATCYSTAKRNGDLLMMGAFASLPPIALAVIGLLTAWVVSGFRPTLRH